MNTLTNHNVLLISIIIPCFNSETFIGQAITSALAQSYPYTEIIVIDDGSTDDSTSIIRALAEHHPGRIRWESGPNRGAPAARNRGLELARGQFVKFLDADDRLLPTCIEKQVLETVALPSGKKAIVYGDALWITENDKLLPGYLVRSRRSDEDPVAHILTQSPLTSCPLHRKEYLDEVGGFDITLPRGQEYDLHLRLVLADVDFVYRPGPVYQYRAHTSQRISTQSYSRKGPLTCLHMVQKQQRAIETKEGVPLKPVIHQTLARRYWSYGRGILREGHDNAAGQYFSTAMSLEPKHCIAGNQPYPVLVRLLGPKMAEKVAYWLHTTARLMATRLK